MAAPVKFTTGQALDILTQYANGLSTKDIADTYRCSRQPIEVLLRARGVYEGRARMRALTADQEPIVVDLYKSGRSARSIGQQYGCNGRAIENILKKYRVYQDRKFRGFSAEQEADVVTRYQSGESANSIAKSYECAGSPVRGVLVKHGAYKPRGFHGVTPEQASEIVQLYQDGATAASLARQFKCSHKPIQAVLEAAGVYDGQRARAGAKFTVHQKRRMADRYTAGASIYALAAEYGCSPNGMWKLLCQLGVEMRFHGKLDGRKSMQGPYVRVQVDESDPIAVAMGWVNGYILEHRLVMARALGRPLATTETVHHKNLDKADNHPDNLQLRQGKHGKGARFVCQDCGSHNVAATPI